MGMFTSRSSRAASAVAVAALAVSTLAACGGEDAEEQITFAAVPAESSATLEASYSNITALIEQETGKKVVFQNASDYAAVIEGMRAGQIDVATFGPFAYVIAKDSGVDMEPAGAPTDALGEPAAYTSLAYVPVGSDVTSLSDLRGKEVCFVDAASTSGYLVPMKGLMDEGVDLNADLTPVMAGGHDASLLSLGAGNCDVAFAHDAMLTTLERTGQVEQGDLVPIWESDAIPEDPIAVNRDSLDDETADKIIEIIREKGNKPALVEAGICPSEDECEMAEETGYGYIPMTDADFDPIRDLCEVTEAEACAGVGA